jgi:hypothetical protein
LRDIQGSELSKFSSCNKILMSQKSLSLLDGKNLQFLQKNLLIVLNYSILISQKLKHALNKLKTRYATFEKDSGHFGKIHDDVKQHKLLKTKST